MAKCCMGSLTYSMVGASGSARTGDLARCGTRHGSGWPGRKGQSGGRRVGWAQATVRGWAARGTGAEGAAGHGGCLLAFSRCPSPLVLSTRCI